MLLEKLFTCPQSVQNWTDGCQCSVLLFHPEILWEKLSAVSTLPLSISLGMEEYGEVSKHKVSERGSITAGESKREGKALERKIVQPVVGLDGYKVPQSPSGCRGTLVWCLPFRQTHWVKVNPIPSGHPYSLQHLYVRPFQDAEIRKESLKTVKAWRLPCNLIYLHYWFVLAEETPGLLASSSKNHKHMLWKFKPNVKGALQINQIYIAPPFFFGAHRDLIFLRLFSLFQGQIYI